MSSESYIGGSRIPHIPEELAGLPLKGHMGIIYSKDDRVERGMQDVKDDGNYDVFVSSQFGVVARRPGLSRESGRIKDTSVTNRQDYRGASVAQISQMASKAVRAKPFNSRD